MPGGSLPAPQPRPQRVASGVGRSVRLPAALPVPRHPQMHTSRPVPLPSRSGLFQDNVYCHITSGLGAGLFAVLCGSPVDVVKSRMMSEWIGPALPARAAAPPRPLAQPFSCPTHRSSSALLYAFDKPLPPRPPLLPPCLAQAPARARTPACWTRL